MSKRKPAPARELMTAAEIGAVFGVSSVTVIQWFKDGKIPAEIAVGKIRRFDLDRVREALRIDAEQRQSETQSGQGGALVI